MFLGKSEVCNTKLLSRAFEKSVFDGNILLLKASEEYGGHRCVYFGGKMKCSFLTNDNLYKYISNMGNNLTSYSLAIGEENISFLFINFKFIKREKINDNELLKSKGSSVDPFDYHVLYCGKYSLKKI